MATPDTLIDTVFDGRYRVLRKLGTGGMANVYLAEDQELGRRVAIKILNERHAADEQFVERFRREAKNAAGLSHPNIVSVYDRGEADGAYYIAMEFLDGRTLKELLITRGPTPIPIAINYTRQILAAIGFAHRNGIVHRDIKPHNVLVDSEGRLKVTDFGIARSGASQMTEVGSIIGTAQYLSPEQARGAPVDRTSDLYSVGVVLYEMLTGSVPFTGDTPVEIAMKHLSAVPEPPSAERPEVPEELDKVVLCSLGKTPAERYASTEEMDADLARIERGLAVSPETAEMATAVLSGAGAAAPTMVTRAMEVAPRRPVAPPPYVPPATGYYGYEDVPPRRRPVWPWLLALALLAAAGVAGYFVYTKIQDQLNATKPVAVQDYRGLRELLAVQKVRDAGLVPDVHRQPNASTALGLVYDQNPKGGNRIDKGNQVSLFVSLGTPKTTVPSVVGSSSTDAVAALANRKLKAKVVQVPSDKPVGTVTATDPKAGKTVVQGTRVRVNVSQGPQKVAVPPVVGQPYDNALGTLQGAGFAVAKTEADSNQPKGTVLAMDPGANTLQPKGTKVTLTVSKGPTTSTVPDVTSLDAATAKSTLESSGFKAKVVQQDTNDQTQDGIVLAQQPTGNAQAKQGSTVTILVGRFTGDTTTTPTTP